AEAVAERYASPWYGDGFQEMIGLATVEPVVICTPTALHVPQAQAALRAGKHVLVQKPLALSCADAEATVALAKQCGRLLFVDYTCRFLEAMGVVRSLLSEGRELRTVFGAVY